MPSSWLELLMRLYPAEYRELFGDEIVAVVGQRLAEGKNRGAIGCAFLVLRETAGLLHSALMERVARGRQRSAYLSSVQLSAEWMPHSAWEGEQRLRVLVRNMEEAIARHDFPRARRFAHAEQRLRLHIERL